MRSSTHDVTIGADEVSKRFTSWARGEAEREWAALTALAEHAPGLAPSPLRRTTEDGRPVVTMSRLPGEPLGDRPLSPPQVAAVAAAITELHDAVPAADLDRFPRRIWHPDEAVAMLRTHVADPPPRLHGDVERAFSAGATWIHSAEATLGEEHPVLGRGDGNIANVLWDGRRCRLVDFEDSGRSDRAFEIADLVEHPSTWLPDVLDADDLVRLLAPSPDAARRVLLARRVVALYWLIMLLPGGPAHRRNPPDSCARQARRLLRLLD